MDKHDEISRYRTNKLKMKQLKKGHEATRTLLNLKKKNPNVLIVSEALKTARIQVRDFLGARDDKEIIFTSFLVD